MAHEEIHFEKPFPYFFFICLSPLFPSPRDIKQWIISKKAKTKRPSEARQSKGSTAFASMRRTANHNLPARAPRVGHRGRTRSSCPCGCSGWLALARSLFPFSSGLSAVPDRSSWLALLFLTEPKKALSAVSDGSLWSALVFLFLRLYLLFQMTRLGLLSFSIFINSAVPDGSHWPALFFWDEIPGFGSLRLPLTISGSLRVTFFLLFWLAPACPDSHGFTETRCLRLSSYTPVYAGGVLEMPGMASEVTVMTGRRMFRMIILIIIQSSISSKTYHLPDLQYYTRG